MSIYIRAMVAAVVLSAGNPGIAIAQETPDPQVIARGATAWTQNCARCHNMRQPTEFRDDLWKPIVTHMRVRAGLTGMEARDILAFLQAGN